MMAAESEKPLLRKQSSLPDAELDPRTAKILQLVQERMNEHLEAIEYSMRTLQDTKQTGVIMTRAEEVKAIEKKVRKGGQLSNEDLKVVKSVDGQLLFGYDEKTRLQKLQQVEDILKKEHAACEKKLTAIQDGFKKARGAEEKEKVKKLYQMVLGERN